MSRSSSLKIEIPFWTTHHNMLLYSAYFYCELHNRKLQISFGHNLPASCAILRIDEKALFFDYSDDTALNDDPKCFDLYMKRSPLPQDFQLNIQPLNFQAIYSYKPIQFLLSQNLKELIQQKNKVEFLRAADYFGLFAKQNHTPIDTRRFPETVSDNGGRILFYTRLWNPANTNDPLEKERRGMQNEFRIAACRIIRKNFENAVVGIYPDDLSAKLAPDVLMDKQSAIKKNYMHALAGSDICIADDGLKDTPGWKIGEYLLFGKSVVSAPIGIVTEAFKPDWNYSKLSTRLSYDELPSRIENLLSNKQYLEMGKRNLEWSANYLHPANYLSRILQQCSDLNSRD